MTPDSHPQPNPEEIAAATAAIRSTWSEREHYVRAGVPVPERLKVAHDDSKAGEPWTVPVVRAAG